MMQPQSNYYYNGQQYDPDDKSPLIHRSNSNQNHHNGEGARHRKNHVRQPQSTGLTSPMSFGGSPASYDSDDYTNSKGNSKQRKASVMSRSFISLCECCCPKSRNSAEEDDQNFYRDDFNDQSWSCSFGTTDEHGTWLNMRDQAGLIMSALVWILMVYSNITFSFLAKTGGIPIYFAIIYCTLSFMALASHAKTTLTDPGTVPQSAVPVESERIAGSNHSMCSQCQTFKPPSSHHCRICNRCISRMDHHCPWMNNCIGAANFKHFILFLMYMWASSGYALLLLGWNYFMCADEECTFTTVLTQLVRIMTLLAIGAFLFTSSMLMNVCYGIMTGIGTIDRLKKKANNTMSQSDEEPIPLKDIFGIQGYHTWLLPVDPLFEDYDRVMGYSTPQRLLREQIRESPGGSGESVIMPINSTESFPV